MLRGLRVGRPVGETFCVVGLFVGSSLAANVGKALKSSIGSVNLVGVDVGALDSDNIGDPDNGFFVTNDGGKPITGMSTSNGGDTGGCCNGPNGLITNELVGDIVGVSTLKGGATGDCGKGDIGDPRAGIKTRTVVGYKVRNPLPGATASSGEDVGRFVGKGFPPGEPFNVGLPVGNGVGNPDTGTITSNGGDTGKGDIVIRTGFATGDPVPFGGGASTTGNEAGWVRLGDAVGSTSVMLDEFLVGGVIGDDIGTGKGGVVVNV